MSYTEEERVKHYQIIKQFVNNFKPHPEYIRFYRKLRSCFVDFNTIEPKSVSSFKFRELERLAQYQDDVLVKTNYTTMDYPKFKEFLEKLLNVVDNYENTLDSLMDNLKI